MPTKALVESANHRSRAGSPSVRYTDAIERKDALTALAPRQELHHADSHDTATVITGHARFVGKRELEVNAGGETISVRGDKVSSAPAPAPYCPRFPASTDRGWSPRRSSSTGTVADLVASVLADSGIEVVLGASVDRSRTPDRPPWST
ncbi:MAG TPA: hypothetical protein VFY98_10255 [Intrasporangium sp.]|nr:hypothetical protein [Intrasporangium sp.]